jgi:hypothetical protein
MSSPDELYKNAQESILNEILSRPQIQEEIEEPHSEVLFQGDELANLPLFDEEDSLILMHRDAHFSGSFSLMREYYENEEAKGVCEEIDRKRILFLESLEKRMKQNLAPLILNGKEAEKVAQCIVHYQKLKILADGPSSFESSLAESILSEEEVDSIVENASPLLFQKPESLLVLAQSEFFCDTLSPGYGTAPMLAVALLGKMKYEPAIKPLFQLIGRGDFTFESYVLEALKKIGGGAKEFAKKLFLTKPYTYDHERAVLLLFQFLPDEEIEKLFAEKLREKDIPPSIRQYLLG